MTRVAVICGTGMSELINDFRIKPDSNVSELRIQSKWGEVPIFVVEINEHRFFILDRHHPKSGARTPPHMIEHRANIFAISSCNPDVFSKKMLQPKDSNDFSNFFIAEMTLDVRFFA